MLNSNFEPEWFFASQNKLLVSPVDILTKGKLKKIDTNITTNKINFIRFGFKNCLMFMLFLSLSRRP